MASVDTMRLAPLILLSLLAACASRTEEQQYIYEATDLCKQKLQQHGREFRPDRYARYARCLYADVMPVQQQYNLAKANEVQETYARMLIMAEAADDDLLQPIDIAAYYDERNAKLCIQPAAYCAESVFVSLPCYGVTPGCPYYN